MKCNLKTSEVVPDASACSTVSVIVTLSPVVGREMLDILVGSSAEFDLKEAMMLVSCCERLFILCANASLLCFFGSLLWLGKSVVESKKV